MKGTSGIPKKETFREGRGKGPGVRDRYSKSNPNIRSDSRGRKEIVFIKINTRG